MFFSFVFVLNEKGKRKEKKDKKTKKKTNQTKMISLI